MPVERLARQVGAWLWAIAGAAATVALWRLILPWDLSEEPASDPYVYDPAGSSGGGGDDYGLGIAVVLLVVTVLALVTILAGRPGARWFGTAAAVTWAALFAWRAAASSVSGANMWPVAFVILVGPAAIGATVLVHAAARWRSRRPSSADPRTS